MDYEQKFRKSLGNVCKFKKVTTFAPAIEREILDKRMARSSIG